MDSTTELWSTKTWQVQENPINCVRQIYCLRHSPDGEHLAIATGINIQIWNPRTKECIANFEGHNINRLNEALNYTLAWTSDGTRLLSGGTVSDSTIREWDPSTWKQVGEPWRGHTKNISNIAVNPAGTLVASASLDCQVRLWRLSDRRTIAIFKHSYEVYSVTFSMDGKHIISGGNNLKVLKWAIPDDALLEVTTASEDTLAEDASKEQATNNAQDSDCEILAINTTVRNACITGDLPTAESLLTQEIDADGNNYNSYANRSFVMARKSNWDRALQDALKAIRIQPSLTGCISKGIALCGTMQFEDAMKAFDLAFMFVDGDSSTIHLLLLIKAIILFNANQHDEAILRVQELASTCPSADTLACDIVEAYLHVQMGTNALDGVGQNEAADHFAAAVNTIAFSSTLAIHSKYDVFVVLFGWDLKSLWRTAHQNWCQALLRAGRLAEALKSYRYMMDRCDEATKASCLDWSTAFKHDCSILHAANGVADIAAKGDAALAAGDCNMAIELYSAAINLDFATDTVFTNRCKARSEKMLWEDALLDAEKVIELTPSSYLGYQLKHAALHGAQRYDEAIEASQIMIYKLENTPDTQIQKLHQQYVVPSEAESAIQETIKTQLDNAPHRLFNTATGHLCNRDAQIHAFSTSTEYKELLSSTIMHADLQQERIKDVVGTYFHYVMLSHRWEGQEPLLRDIQDKLVYELDPVGGIAKLQSFCKTARNAGYRWAWVDTCCIDQSNNVEVQESVNSMFVWYRHLALTIVYLSDVASSSKSGALASSAWNTRGWTVQEFLAPNIVLFYQKDWSLYLGDRSLNHKDSAAIMKELGDATGIDAQALVAFRPGMRGAREKLQWVSTRVTTWQEDIAYSLFGIFGVNLPVIYGEKKQKALGRLLQEVVAQSGDISALDWVGQSSEFNSCLPADIISYKAPSYTLPSLSADEIRSSVSSLQNVVAVETASKLYTMLDNMTAPRFANCRLQLPCIAFRVTAVRRSRAPDPETHLTYEVKTDGLRDLLITTEDKSIPYSRTIATRQTFLLIRPWDRYLLEQPDSGDDTQSVEDFSALGSPGEHGLIDAKFHSWTSRLFDRLRQPLGTFFDSLGRSSGNRGPADLESHLRALRLIVRLGQPFHAFVLAQQRGGEYKRIATERNIIAQVQDMSSVRSMMDVRTVEIL
ncbi:hypothetical protein DFH29DRAFT_124342 [Suillus ampliporus]|nr:hypothetical protein DFH29DRAFT_124342 [Suillus ampliporus]